jgi:hypothetical protein
MARATFQKRQKEIKRMEKQRTKAERRAQRKFEKRTQSNQPDRVEKAAEEAGSEEL